MQGGKLQQGCEKEQHGFSGHITQTGGTVLVVFYPSACRCAQTRGFASTQFLQQAGNQSACPRKEAWEQDRAQKQGQQTKINGKAKQEEGARKTGGLQDKSMKPQQTDGRDGDSRRLEGSQFHS